MQYVGRDLVQPRDRSFKRLQQRLTCPALFQSRKDVRRQNRNRLVGRVERGRRLDRFYRLVVLLQAVVQVGQPREILDILWVGLAKRLAPGETLRGVVFLFEDARALHDQFVGRIQTRRLPQVRERVRRSAERVVQAQVEQLLSFKIQRIDVSGLGERVHRVRIARRLDGQ